MAEDLGAGSVKFNVIQPTARGEKLHEAEGVVPLAELIRLGRWIEKELAAQTSLSLYFDYPHAFRPLSRIASGQGCGVCGVLGILGVIPSGQYALCGIGEHLPELVFGQVGVDPLDEVWRNHPLLNELREGLPSRLGGVCGRCLMKHRCLGSCLAQNYYRMHDLWAPFWFCEQAEQAGLFPASRLAT